MKPATNTTRRQYTLDDYKRDLAALDLRHHDAPALRQLLDEQVTASLELPPVSAVVRRPTLLGGLCATVAESAKPVTAAVLRAVGLTPRPSGRLRCGFLPVLLAVAAALFSACSPEPYVLSAEPGEPDLTVWAEDDELATAAVSAAVRLKRATGLVVAVAGECLGVPVLWEVPARMGAGTWGETRYDRAGMPTDIAIAAGVVPPARLETVVLRELMHALGVIKHVDQDAGVLSPKAERPYPLTAADLESVCSVRACPVFVPEG